MGLLDKYKENIRTEPEEEEGPDSDVLDALALLMQVNLFLAELHDGWNFDRETTKKLKELIGEVEEMLDDWDYKEV